MKGKLFYSGLKSGVVATGSQGRVAATTATTTENPQHDPAMASEPSSAVPLIYVAAGLALRLPQRLPSVEEELEVMAVAVEGLRQLGLSRQVSRLHKIIQGVTVYRKLFAKFVNYHASE